MNVVIAAAQKGRTQLCALLLAHGADPFMNNQENQTPIQLAIISQHEDVKCLLQDAMTMSISPTVPAASTTGGGIVCVNSSNQSILVSPTTETETVTLPTGASMTLTVPVPVPQTPSRSCMSPAQGQGAESHGDGASELNESDVENSVAGFLMG